MAAAGTFATFIIIGPTCFFLGMIFASFPYDYNILWSAPTDPTYAFQMFEEHLKFLHASPPLVSRILHIVIATGLLGFLMKLYKASESNMLFDGASLVLYMAGITVYITNLVKGLRVVTLGIYGNVTPEMNDDKVEDYIGREDTLRVYAASNTILALVLVGVLVLQAGQWYALRKEEAEVKEIENKEAEKKKAGKKKQ